MTDYSNLEEISRAIQTALLEMPHGCFEKGRESSVCGFISCACMDRAAKAAIEAIKTAAPTQDEPAEGKP